MADERLPLSPAQLAQIRDELHRALDRLERSMKTTDEAMRPVALDQSAVGRLSRIDSLQNQGLTRNLQERERAKLGQLLEALRKIEEGRFGLCQSCGAPIGFERLLVFPEAVACAGCIGGS